jgi:dienelactone hydrolase
MTLASIPVQVWYPATGDAVGRRAPYRLGAPASSLRKRIMDAFVGTNAVLDAPVAAGKHAVLMYAPSWGGLRFDNTAQAQNLASHGFIVAAFDDLFPGREMDLSSADAYQTTVAWATRKARLEAAAMQRVVSALDNLDAGVPPTRFAGHVDPARTGAFGFSFGGAVAAQAASVNSRITAAVDLDGWIFADAAERGVSRPFMIVSATNDDLRAARASQGDHRFSDRLDALNAKQIVDGFERYGGYFLTLRGANHYNFCDVALLPSIRHTGVGPIDGRRGAAIVGTYLEQFFDRYLNAAPAPLLTAQARMAFRDRARMSADPAAELQIWHSPSIGVLRNDRTERVHPLPRKVTV